LIIIKNNYFVSIIYSMPKRTVNRRRTRGGGFFDFLTGKKDQTQMYGQTPYQSSQSSFSNFFQRRQPQTQMYGQSPSQSSFSNFFQRRQPQPQLQPQSISPSYNDGQYNGNFGGGRRRKTRKTRKGRKMRTRKNR
jgi:hypothetical protein